MQNKFFLKTIQIALVCLIVLGGGLWDSNEAEAKTYKITADCAVVAQNTDCVNINLPFPSPNVPNCPPGFREFHYADRTAPGSVPIPADYNSGSSDPWVGLVVVPPTKVSGNI